MDVSSQIIITIAGGLACATKDGQTNSSITEISDSIRKQFSSIDIQIIDYADIDSSLADLDFFYDLARTIQRKMNSHQVKGMILVYGTDTMEILAYFLHRCIINHNKPIVITGSTRETKNFDFDGRANLCNSIKQILNKDSIFYSNGVSINFAGKIHNPSYFRKEHTFSIDPFTSGKSGIIGMMHGENIDWRGVLKRPVLIPLPNKLESIPIVCAYPGAPDFLLDVFLNRNFKAVVIIAYGSGNVSEELFYSIKKAIEFGIKVILVTKCQFGGVSPEYAGVGGNQSLIDLGVVMASDLNAYQAMVVASLVIGNSMSKNGTNLDSYFNNEITKN
ncbi:L-asparaginase [Brachionus plicatilis]|uniref:asparaginase n=1 Tax=Brachionus plicatilis TaxID=10195 RepID=A0A3M7QC97_BRAPC|nr:L-asparaginase [Brachionus plicatilis]